MPFLLSLLVFHPFTYFHSLNHVLSASHTFHWIIPLHSTMHNYFEHSLPLSSTIIVPLSSIAIIRSTSQHHFSLLDSLSDPTELPVIESFLKRDICCRYADKYLLAMVFTYFARAGLTREQYTKEYFFAALWVYRNLEFHSRCILHHPVPLQSSVRVSINFPFVFSQNYEMFLSLTFLRISLFLLFLQSFK